MAVRNETDPRRKLQRYGEHLAAVAPRHVPFQLVILDAAANDSEADNLWQQLQAERLGGMTMFANALATEGHLRADVTADDARHVLWMYNSAEVYRLLVVDRGWSPERYGAWIADASSPRCSPDRERQVGESVCRGPVRFETVRWAASSGGGTGKPPA